MFTLFCDLILKKKSFFIFVYPGKINFIDVKNENGNYTLRSEGECFGESFSGRDCEIL